MSVAPLRRRAALVAALACAIGLGAPVPSHAQGKSALNLAMVAEPPTLDIQSTPADLVCIIMQHVYEPLFTFDSKATGADAGRNPAQGVGRRQELQHHAAQGRDAAQRPRAQRRRRGGQPEALDGAIAARQGGGQGSGEPAGQGPAPWRSPEAALCAAALATGAAQRHGRHHGQGNDRHAAARSRRQRALPVQGAQARPVRAADALRQVQRAQGAAQRLRRQARGRRSRSCASCRCPTPTRASKARWPASTTTPTCCRWKRCARLEKAARQDGADHDAVVRLPLPGVQHQGRRGAIRRCARRCRRRWARARCWRPASATRASSSPKATTSPRARRSTRRRHRRTTTSATPQGQGRPSRPATRASRSAC